MLLHDLQYNYNLIYPHAKSYAHPLSLNNTHLHPLTSTLHPTSNQILTFDSWPLIFNVQPLTFDLVTDGQTTVLYYRGMDSVNTIFLGCKKNNIQKIRIVENES